MVYNICSIVASVCTFHNKPTPYDFHVHPHTTLETPCANIGVVEKAANVQAKALFSNTFRIVANFFPMPWLLHFSRRVPHKLVCILCSWSCGLEKNTFRSRAPHSELIGPDIYLQTLDLLSQRSLPVLVLDLYTHFPYEKNFSHSTKLCMHNASYPRSRARRVPRHGEAAPASLPSPRVERGQGAA